MTEWPIVVRPSRPLLTPPSRLLTASAGCRIASRRPSVAPPSRRLIVPDSCCVDSRHAAVSSTHYAALSAIEHPPPPPPLHAVFTIRRCHRRHHRRHLRCQMLHPHALTKSHHFCFCHRHHRQPVAVAAVISIDLRMNPSTFLLRADRCATVAAASPPPPPPRHQQ